MSNKNQLEFLTGREKNIKTVSWRFRDIDESYPDIKNQSKVKITSPQDLYENFKHVFDHRVKEIFVVFWLSSSNKVIGYEIISEGTLNTCLTAPREVFRGAIVATATNIIIAHNHPSGNNEFSSEDIAVTKKLVEVGKIVDINVFDSLIFTDHNYNSAVQNRLI